MLMDQIISHPGLKAVRRMELYCRPELRDFYRNRFSRTSCRSYISGAARTLICS